MNGAQIESMRMTIRDLDKAATAWVEDTSDTGLTGQLMYQVGFAVRHLSTMVDNEEEAMQARERAALALRRALHDI